MVLIGLSGLFTGMDRLFYSRIRGGHNSRKAAAMRRRGADGGEQAASQANHLRPRLKVLIRCSRDKSASSSRRNRPATPACRWTVRPSRGITGIKPQRRPGTAADISGTRTKQQDQNR